MTATITKPPNVKTSLEFANWNGSAGVSTSGITLYCGKSQRSRTAFHEPADYIVFLALLRQNLRLPQWKGIDLLAYSLTSRSYQLVMRHSTAAIVSEFMHTVLVAYNAYYIRRYQARQAIFSDVYKSTQLVSSNLLLDVSLQLHTTTDTAWWLTSSAYYTGTQIADWIQPYYVLRLVGGRTHYQRRLKAYAKRYGADTKKSPSRAILRRSMRS